MIAIAKHEFWQLFKSVKSILVILILLSSSYFVSQNGAELIAFLNDGGEDKEVYYSGLSIVLLLFGPLFAFTLSHDVINREVSSKTIRFLLTRTSHANILMGKLLGVLSFWFVCLVCSYMVIIMYARHIEFYLFIQMMLLLIFSVSLAFLLSVGVSKPFMSMFISTVLGLALPIVSLLLISTDKWWGLLGYITPYQYMQNDDWKIVFMLLIGSAIMGLTYIVFKRRAY